MKKIISLFLIFLLCACSVQQPKEEYEDTFEGSVLTNSSDELRLTMLDVGQADCTLIQQSDTVIMIDSGNDLDGGLIVQTLYDLGIEKIDCLVATHPHEDHIGGMDDVLNAFDVEQVIGFYSDFDSVHYSNLLNSMQHKGLKFTEVSTNDRLEFGNIVLDILHVDPKNKDINDASISFILSYKSIDMFFGGDISSKIEQQLIDQLDSIELYKVNHHGSKYSSNASFLRKMEGGIALISCGKDNQYGYPHKRVVQSLEEADFDVYRSDTQGSIRCESDGVNLGCKALYNQYPSIENKIIGNISSKVFHHLDCQYLPSKDNQIPLYSENIATLLGYRPHKQCIN